MNYLISYEDLKYIISEFMPNTNFKRSLAEYILRMDYRNTYGQVEESLEVGELTDMSRGYPPNLVSTEVDIPISRYGFINSESIQKYGKYPALDDDFLRGDIPEYRVDEIFEGIHFNVNDVMREDLIKHFEYKLNMIKNTSDFSLVDYCHELELFQKYVNEEVEVKIKEVELHGIKREMKYLRGNEELLDKKYSRPYTKKEV